MKNHLLLAGVVGLIAGTGNALPPEQSWFHEASRTNYSISISTSTNRFTPRDPIIVFVRLKNVGQIPLSVARREPPADYVYEITGPDGSRVDALKLFRERSSLDNSRGLKGGEFDPGWERVEAIRLNAFFDFSVPGTYKLQLRRQLFSDLNRGTPSIHSVTSNVLQIEMDCSREEVETVVGVANPDKLVPPYLKKVEVEK
jgi:hypothetical protein